MVIDTRRMEAFEWARDFGLNTEEQIEFADFQVGFPDRMPLEDIMVAYQMAKHGPAQISMHTQEATT